MVASAFNVAWASRPCVWTGTGHAICRPLRRPGDRCKFDLLASLHAWARRCSVQIILPPRSRRATRRSMPRRRPRSPDANEYVNVVRVSMVVCRRHMAAYAHPRAKHTFTQAQLMTCLVLKAYLDLTYRGVVQLLDVS